MNYIISILVVAVVVGGGALLLSRDSTGGIDAEARTMADSFAHTFGKQQAGTSLTQHQPATAAAAPITTNDTERHMQATFTTNLGSFTIEFYDTLAPNTVANFTKLAKEGFYDGVKFHRVIEGFMIQGGDPLTKDESMQARWGTGGPGYQFADEIHAENRNEPGTISMANAGPNTNGSQFFINTKDNAFLDGKHTVFGKIVSGMETVTAIEKVETGPMDRPLEPVIIEKVTLE